MPFTLSINGQPRSFENLSSQASLAQVIEKMKLKGDRIAVEHNGEIVQRARWPETTVSSGDRLEIVHFVGGGAGSLPAAVAERFSGTVQVEQSGRGRELAEHR